MPPYGNEELERFFSEPLAERDPVLKTSIDNELGRQQSQIVLIASENIVSAAVMEAQGGVMTNKYAEGYSGRRYYGGCEFVDVAETLAIDRAKELFGSEFVNVQPHSGCQANGAVMMALLQPGDTIMGLSLAAGGHLTHGAPPAQSGKWFNAVQYGVRKEDALIDFDEVESLAQEHSPKMIIAGGSAYPRTLDFERFRAIADKVGALLMVDMAHFAGLVATGHHPSPVPIADVTTTTTHKTLRGPRGGMTLTNNEDFAKKINSAVFPGLQGGPLMHVIAAKAICFKEAMEPEFKTYQQQVVKNAQAMAKVFIDRGYDIVSGGTEDHLFLLSLIKQGVTGKDADAALGRAHITVNKNAVPNDPQSPFVTSGLRIGTPAVTTRGFGEEECTQLAGWICDILDVLAKGEDTSSVEAQVLDKVAEVCGRFPVYK